MKIPGFFFELRRMSQPYLITAAGFTSTPR